MLAGGKSRKCFSLRFAIIDKYEVMHATIYATADEAMRIRFTNVFFLFLFVFFLFFVYSFRHKNTRQPFSGTAERIFMKLLPNDTGENGVSNVVPPPGE